MTKTTTTAAGPAVVVARKRLERVGYQVEADCEDRVWISYAMGPNDDEASDAARWKMAAGLLGYDELGIENRCLADGVSTVYLDMRGVKVSEWNKAAHDWRRNPLPDIERYGVGVWCQDAGIQTMLTAPDDDSWSEAVKAPCPSKNGPRFGVYFELDAPLPKRGAIW